MLTPSLYFHIPFCHGKCRYCSFYSTEPASDTQVKDLLKTELTELKQRLTPHHSGTIPTIYIGGGSPSVIHKHLPEFIEKIRNLLNKLSISFEKAEFTVEINPGDINRDFLRQLSELGVNRISIGTQSFAEEELRLLGRRHNVADIYNAVENCLAVGLSNISLDLIFALPNQTLAQWQDNLNRAIELDPRHISVYSLTWEPGTEFDRARALGQLKPAEDTLDREMYYLALDTLAEAGIQQYEISNFARGGYESRHNIRYWDDEEYIGIGPSAGSHIANSRWTSIADISKYINCIDNNSTTYDEVFSSTAEENIRHAAILALRKNQGINIDLFHKRFGISPLEYFQNEIKENINSGLLKHSGNHIHLTRKGLSFADSVSLDFI